MADIARFTLVQISSSASGKPTVVAWSPGSSEQPALSASNKLLGVTMTASNDEEPVAVMKRGYMRGVSGSSWSVGDSLWGTSGGVVSKTRPAAPLTQVFVGTVYESEGGSLYSVNVDVRIIPSIGELSGVTNETWADRDFLVFNSTALTWEPRPPHRHLDATTTVTTPALRNDTILCDATSAGFTVTLPSAASSTDARFTIKKTDSTRNIVTIDGASTEIVEDAETQELRLQGESLTLHCDGTKWWVVA